MMTTKELIAYYEKVRGRGESQYGRDDETVIWLNAILARLRMLERAMPVFKQLADENIVDDHFCLLCDSNIFHGEAHEQDCEVNNILRDYAVMEDTKP